MIKKITKTICVCDMCGFEYGWNKNEAVVPKEVFGFIVNLETGGRTIQICPKCQVKLKDALYQHLTRNIGYRINQEEEEND